MSDECTEERFLEDVKNHKLEIINDNGVNRHLRMKREGSSCYYYDITTWGNHLCISGDMGCYVFSRLHDMFEFFRMDSSDFNYSKDRKLNINRGYWGEKLQAYPKNGYREFSEDRAKKIMYEYIDNNLDGSEWTSEEISDLKDDSLQCLWDSNEVRVYDEISSYEYINERLGEKFEFSDWWEYASSCEDYSFHYVWCCYAIQYAIQEYDKKSIA